MAKINKNKLIRDLNEIRIGQEVRVINRIREGERVRIERGPVVTVRDIQRVSGQVTVLDAMGAIASDMDGSTSLERV